MSTEPKIIALSVDSSQDGVRLDRALAARVADTSRSRIARHIRLGAVTVDGELPARGPKTIVRAGQRIEYTPPPPESSELVPEPMDLDVLFEDEHFIAINKAAGIVVHPAPGHRHGTLVHGLLHRFQREGATPTVGAETGRPGIVHRLDQGTTGVILVAKRDAAHEALARLFQERAIEKRYIAFCAGEPAEAHGRIETRYGRHPRDRKKFSSKVSAGKNAITEFRTEARYGGAARLGIQLHTGRTHQIRVHFADRGLPLIGDATYGYRPSRLPAALVPAAAGMHRPALHAESLCLDHPVTGASLRIEAPWPPDLCALADALADAADPPTKP